MQEETGIFDLPGQCGILCLKVAPESPAFFCRVQLRLYEKVIVQQLVCGVCYIVFIHFPVNILYKGQGCFLFILTGSEFFFIFLTGRK